MERCEHYPLGGQDRFCVFREGTYRPEDLDLQRLDKMEHWHVAEGEPDIRGWSIYSPEREHLGDVSDLVASPQTRQVYFVVAHIGGVLGIGGKHVLVPLDVIHIDRDDRVVHAHATRDQFEDAVEWHSDRDTDYVGGYRYWHERVSPAVTERRELAGVAGGEAPAAGTGTVPGEEVVAVRREVAEAYEDGDIEVKGDIDVK